MRWVALTIVAVLFFEGVLILYTPNHVWRHRMKQPTLTPTSKVTAAGLGGAIVLVAIWIAGLFDVEIPAEVAAALTTLVSFAAGWFKLEERGVGA